MSRDVATSQSSQANVSLFETSTQYSLLPKLRRAFERISQRFTAGRDEAVPNSSYLCLTTTVLQGIWKMLCALVVNNCFLVKCDFSWHALFFSLFSIEASLHGIGGLHWLHSLRTGRFLCNKQKCTPLKQPSILQIDVRAPHCTLNHPNISQDLPSNVSFLIAD